MVTNANNAKVCDAEDIFKKGSNMFHIGLKILSRNEKMAPDNEKLACRQKKKIEFILRRENLIE